MEIAHNERILIVKINNNFNEQFRKYQAIE